ncbi:hypothetical protein ACM26V_00335 [Salipaludibacillus sp. HK11]|uniref:hypothetical protein n=1 Tax=Salipaludibacillus sp. HK11 TaxID=3394320 RepID=UPI0039FD0725
MRLDEIKMDILDQYRYPIKELRADNMFWLLERAEKAENLQEKLNEKIMFVSNGMEEEHYSLQEKLIRYEKALKEIALRKGDFYEDEVASIAEEAINN